MNPVMQRTLFVFVSDHGHTPIDWNKALGLDDLKMVFDDLNDTRGKAYRLEVPALVDETVLSKVRAAFGFFSDGTISGDSNVVATLNGGALGFHVKPSAGQWQDTPDYQHDIAPILEHVLLTLHKNEQGPEAVLYKHESRYVYIPYQYDGATVHLLPAVGLDQSPFEHARLSDGGTKVRRARSTTTHGSAECAGYHSAGRPVETTDVSQLTGWAGP